MKNKRYIKEVKQLQKIAGILKEDDDFDLSINPLNQLPDSEFREEAGNFLSLFYPPLVRITQADKSILKYKSFYELFEDMLDGIDDDFTKEEYAERFKNLWYDEILPDAQSKQHLFKTLNDYKDFFDHWINGIENGSVKLPKQL